MNSENEAYPNKLEEDILKYINMSRVDPNSIIEILRKSVAIFETKKEEFLYSLQSNEKDEIMDTIQNLQVHKTVVKLEYLKSLQASAKNQLAQILKNGELTHIGENYEGMTERIRKTVGSKGSFAECFVVGNLIAETIVLSLLIDVGLEDKPNREILLNNNFKSVGIAFSRNFEGSSLCVLHFYGDSKSRLTAVFLDNELDNAPW